MPALIGGSTGFGRLQQLLGNAERGRPALQHCRPARARRQPPAASALSCQTAPPMPRCSLRGITRQQLRRDRAGSALPSFELRVLETPRLFLDQPAHVGVVPHPRTPRSLIASGQPRCRPGPASHRARGFAAPLRAAAARARPRPAPTLLCIEPYCIPPLAGPCAWPSRPFRRRQARFQTDFKSLRSPRLRRRRTCYCPQRGSGDRRGTEADPADPGPKIGDTLHDGNSTRSVAVINACPRPLNPVQPRRPCAPIDYQVLGAPEQFRVYPDDEGDSRSLELGGGARRRVMRMRNSQRSSLTTCSSLEVRRQRTPTCRSSPWRGWTRRHQPGGRARGSR